MHKSRGVALISVLLVVAILIAIVGRLMAKHGLTISQNQNVFERSQALQYALGAETLARQALAEDVRQTGPDVDHLGEFWAQPTMPFELDEGGFLEAQLTDLNGCFNLNNVIGANAQIYTESFDRLLDNLNIPRQVGDAWIDWIDVDEQVTDFGAEDSEYLLATIPHRTPNALVYDVSELAQLQNLDREAYAALAPHVCLLPETETLINVNTANAHTLASLDQSLSPSSVEALTTSVREYAQISDFLDENDGFRAAGGVLTTSSQYFRLHAFAQVGDTSVTLLSVLRRDPSNGEVTVLSRNFGKLFRSQIDVSVEEAS